MTGGTDLGENLCLHCGLCCDGTLFRDVELQPGDDAEQLRALGLPVRGRHSEEANSLKFPQPCSALCQDLRCRIYADRPARCRQFGCALFQAVTSGQTELPAALMTIRKTRQLAEKVRRLLRELGDAGGRVSLSRRFKRLKRKFDAGELPTGLDTETAYDRFAELSLAVHELDLRLRAKFHPDPSDG